MWGTLTTFGGGGTPGRDQLDTARIGGARIPSAEYPDGYLGTVPSRRGDRLLDSLKGRENQKSYQRGVHKGERIDPGDYLWPDGLKPNRGLKNEARGMKTAPRQDLVPAPHLVNDGKTNTRAKQPGEIDVHRQSQLRSLCPVWR